MTATATRHTTPIAFTARRPRTLVRPASAQDSNKIFSQKNTADDVLDTGLDRWEVKLFDVVNTYDSSAVHSSASGDAGTTWVGIKDAVVDSTDGSTKTKLDAYQSPAKAVLMLDATVTDNNGGLTPEPDDGQDPCGKDGCRSVDLTVQKVWKDGNLERPQSVELKIAAHYTDGRGNTVTPQTIQCFGADCTTVTQKNPWTVTLDSSDASSWSNTWRKVIQGLPVAFVDGQDANGKDIVRYYTYTVEETAVTYKDAIPPRPSSPRRPDTKYRSPTTPRNAWPLLPMRRCFRIREARARCGF